MDNLLVITVWRYVLSVCDVISRILIKKRIYITYTSNFATESKYSVHLVS